MYPQLTLHKLSLQHAHSLYELTVANRDYLRIWLPWLDQIQSRADTEQFIQSTLEESAAGSALNFAIVFDGEICGVTGFNGINMQHRIGDIGYWLAQNYTGNGIVTAAVSQLLEIGFNELHLNKIEIHCAEGNFKSRAIPERLGFTCEATLRQREWLYSKFVNHAIYSILASEYNNRELL